LENDMPNVAGKEYKYTKKGMAQAKAAAKKTGATLKYKKKK